MFSAFPRRLRKPAFALVVVLTLAWAGHFGLRAWQFATLLEPPMIWWNFRNMDWLFPTLRIRARGAVSEFTRTPPTPSTEESSNQATATFAGQADDAKFLATVFSFGGKTIAIRDWIEKSGTTGLVVVADNGLAFEQYYQGNTAQSQAISWSIAKSFVSALIGFALDDGSIASLHDPVGKYVPLLKESGFADVSIQDVLEMSSGIDFSEDYADSESGINQLGEEIFFGYSTNKWIAKLQKKSGLSGKQFDYISVNTQVLEAATQQKLATYMEAKLWSRLGAEADALWLTDAHGTELGFGGLCMRTRDYARFGQLYLDQGRNLKGEQLLCAPLKPWLH